MTALGVLCGTFDPYDSYGKIAVALVEQLDALGVQTVPLGPSILHATQSERLQGLLTCEPHGLEGTLALGWPTLWAGWADQKDLVPPVIAVTMWESSVLPDGWAEHLNRCAAVVVPSQWQVGLFKAAGVRAPLHVVPLGLSNAFQYTRRLPNRKPFTFLTMSDRGRRKGWDVTVQAFHAAFGDDPRYRLIVKARNRGHWRVRVANVENLACDMSEQELAELYGRADAFVFATRGEGFGLPPREAAATGLPVIATNWGGTADDIRAWGYPLRYMLVDAWQDTPSLTGTGQQAEPDFDHLVELMRYVASGNPMIAQMARHSARRVRRLYDWRAFATRIKGIWQKATDVPMTERRRKWKAKQQA